MVGVRSPRAVLSVDYASQSGHPHQLGHSFAGYPKAHFPQFHSELGAAVASAKLPEKLLDRFGELAVLFFLHGGLAFEPMVVSAAADLEQAAYLLDGKMGWHGPL